LATPDQTKEIDLDFSGVPQAEIIDLKREIAEVVIDEIQSYLAKGESPVDGQSFPSLSKKYAESEKNGNRTPNLNLQGDLWDSLAVEFDDSKMIVGVFDKRETPKADGHNNFSGDSKLPQRRFIPNKDESFRPAIMRKVQTLIDSRKSTQQDEDEADYIRSILRGGALEIGAAITINEVIASRLIDDLLEGSLEV
jgi:phage gpG-like protein